MNSDSIQAKSSFVSLQALCWVLYLALCLACDDVSSYAVASLRTPTGLVQGPQRCSTSIVAAQFKLNLECR
ncbi:hypothetical protein C8Q70DRAFT_1032718 [Cubamyces menziesii]|nr:hypothetical protein C8Q70DRAFT_1032718 [Cubamyces menziesii]